MPATSACNDATSLARASLTISRDDDCGCRSVACMGSLPLPLLLVVSRLVPDDGVSKLAAVDEAVVAVLLSLSGGELLSGEDVVAERGCDSSAAEPPSVVLGTISR